MSSSILILFAVLAGGQGPGKTTGYFSNDDGADSKFADSVFKMPIYPGAKLVVGSSQRIHIDRAKGWLSYCQRLPAGGWGRAFSTPTDIAKVEAFYKTQGAKLGKVNTPLTRHDSYGFVLGFDLPKKDEHLIVVGGRLEKNAGTQFEMYYFTAKRPSANKS